MKLIDLLVQELPKRGGWPLKCNFIAQDDDGAAWCFENEPLIDCGEWMDGVSRAGFLCKLETLSIAEDCHTAIITRDQYEAALADAQRLVWDGQGLPPVGCECEGKQFAQINWTKFKVVALANDHVFGFWNDSVPVGLSPKMWEFRPIRSEADKERDEAIAKITDAICGEIPDTGMATAAKYAVRAYDAIAAGKIPHIKLSD